MKKLFLLLLPAALFITSCGSDDDAAASFQISCTYLDVQDGTKITTKYETVATGSSQTLTTEIVSQETVDGVLYAVAESDGFAGQSYLTCEGSNFLTYAGPQSTSSGGVTTETGDINLVYELGAAIGVEKNIGQIISTTTAQGETFTTTNTYFGTVTDNDMTMEVEGTTYNNVVRYEIRIVTESSAAPGSTFEIAKSVNYFAPDVSTIYTETIDVFSGDVTNTTSLVDFEY